MTVLLMYGVFFKVQALPKTNALHADSCEGRLFIIRRPLFGNQTILFRIRGFASTHHHGFAIF
jgi:hypothetical protein